MKNISLTVDNLLETAAKKTRLTDFGDENFHLPLERLLDSFEKEHGVDAVKKFSFSYILSEILTRRLYIQDNFKSHPEILNIPVDRPLFITGLPRTGTTLMHNLLSLGRCWRVLQYWELLYPYYRPDLGANNREYFLRLTEQLIEGLNRRYPGLISRHETKASGPEECNHLLRNTFYSNTFAAEWDLYGYLKWYLEQDLTASYRYYRKLLQLLLWRTPGQHLLLKCPAHLFAVDVILKVFPDANIIWMHRDPCKSIASVLSLYSVFRETETKVNDFVELYLDYFGLSLQKIMEAIKKAPGRITCIGYKKLVKNQADVTREISGQFGYSCGEEIGERIAGWLAENPQHKHGVHTYGLEAFGLSPAGMKKRYSQYYDEYGSLL